MAWQYPAHSCGHSGDRYQAYGHHTDRERQLAAIEAHPCPQCRENAAKQKDEAAGLPALVSSSKQISWASDIRERALRMLPADRADKLRPETSAKWWIDHRQEVN